MQEKIVIQKRCSHSVSVPRVAYNTACCTSCPPPPETNTKQHTIKLFLRYVSDFPCSIEPSRVLKEVGYTCMSTSEHLGALMDVLDKYFYRSPFALTQQRSIATAIKEKQINILHTYQCKPAQQLNTLFQGHTLANNYVPPFLP